MSKKSKKSKHPSKSQLSLLEESFVVEDLKDENYEDYEDGMDGDPNDREVEPPAPELITLKLLRRAISAQNPNDDIMRDFGEYVLPNLLRVAIGTTAKGGKYFERKEREYYERQVQEGRETIRPLSRRSADDQSLNTHLLNGLFPANQIEQRLEELDTTIQRIVRPKPERRRLAIAGFILHDFEKFDYNRFPSMPEAYKAVEKDKIRKLSVDDHSAILDIIIQELGLNLFLNPEDPQAYKNQINGILYIAYNAQRKDDTNLNTAEFGLGRDSNIYVELSNLARLADLLASIIKHPQDAESQSLYSTLHELSDGQLQLTYHSIAENHGVLTNVVNNAVMDEFISMNTSERKYYEPLLYLPTGVIYLKLKDAPSISAANLPDQVVEKIKEICVKELNPELKPGEVKPVNKGFLRDGKGLKYAEYCEQLFDDFELMKVALRAAQSLIRNSKATERSKSLLEFQKKGVLSSKFNFEFGERLLIDQLAEFGDLITRKIWGNRVTKIQSWAKANKQKFSLGDLESGDHLVLKIAEHIGLSEHLPQIREIQQINESLKNLKLKGNTGGLPLEWYYLAAQYIKANSGQEDITEAGYQIIECVTALVSPLLRNFEDLQTSLRENIEVDSGNKGDGWDDLRDWVCRVVMMPSNQATSQDKFFEELKNYNAAKQQRRGKQLICSITHSAYTVKEQMESGVLFTPQVYTNKQMLFGSNAKRNISSIAAIEFMLRQILMSETQEVGKKFEDGKYRYLYFYPTYYFTPETNKFLHQAYDEISQARFDTGIRDHFISKDSQVDLSLERYQTAQLFQLNEAKTTTTEEEQPSKKGRIFKLSYLENQPITFYFMALPPEKRGKTDPTDTESWVMPTWLAFAFPLILDVKTVVSESPIPPCTDGTEFEQTVFLDSAPQAFQALTQEERFRLDYILNGWERNGARYPAPLNVLTAAYAIHLDVNAKRTAKGFNPNWGKLTELARDFETSPLHVFSYLKDWVRGLSIDTPGIAKIKLYAYEFYPCFDPYVEYKSELEALTVDDRSQLHHPKKLTELFRKFYRAKSTKGQPTKANAILKPIDEAADVILKAELSACRGETLVDYVAARLASLMNRVHSSTAEGRWVFKNSERDQEREAILDFSRYFVMEVFEGTFKGDRARLAGRQLNLIRDTCEFLYRLEDDKERRKKKEQGIEDPTTEDSEQGT